MSVYKQFIYSQFHRTDEIKHDIICNGSYHQSQFRSADLSVEDIYIFREMYIYIYIYINNNIYKFTCYCTAIALRNVLLTQYIFDDSAKLNIEWRRITQRALQGSVFTQLSYLPRQSAYLNGLVIILGPQTNYLGH